MAVDIFDAEQRQPVDIFSAERGTPPVRNVGAGEAFSRDLGGGFASQANVLGLAGATPFMLVDAAQNLFRKTPTTAAQDWYFGSAYEPTVKNAVDYYADKPGEQRDLAATLAGAGGTVLSAVPAMVATGGAPSTFMLPRALDMLLRGAVTAQPSFAVPQTVGRAQQLLEADVDPATVAKASASNWGFNTAMGAAPVSIPGRLAVRAPSGAAINVAGGAASRGSEGAILGPENAKVAQPAFGEKETTTDAVLGTALAGLLGRRAPTLPRAAPRPEPTLAPVDDTRVPYDPPPIYDPQAALREVSDALFRTEDGAPQPPDGMKLVPRGQEAPIVYRGDPDVSEVPVRVAPEWTLDGGSDVGRVRRGFDEPRLEPDDTRVMNLVEAVERMTSGMQPNVPMPILKTIAQAARDSGLEAQIYPRITSKGGDDGVPVRSEQAEQPSQPAAAVEAPRLPALEQPVAPQGPITAGAGAPRPAAPVRAVDAPKTELERIAAVRLPGHYGKQPAASPVASKPVREVRKGSSFLQALRKSGGIDSSFSSDIAGDTPTVVNRRMPGLFRKGGMSADGLLEWAIDNGYITKADADRADREGVGGAQEVARNLVRRAMADEDVLPLMDQEAKMVSDAKQQLADEQAEHAYRMANEPEYRAEQEQAANETARRAGEIDPDEAADRARWSVEEATAVGLKEAEARDVDEVAQALAKQQNAIEQLATQHPDGGPEFMEGVRKILYGERSSDQAPARGEAGEPQDGGAPSQAGRPELNLEQQTEAGLRAKADTERRAAEQRSLVENAPPPGEFKLTGSDRSADRAAAQGQTDLFNAKGEPAKKPAEDAPGGGTLYGGLPLDKVAGALKWAVGDVKSWADSIGRFAKDIRSAVDRTPHPEGNPLARFVRAVFDSSSGDMRSVLKKNPSPTAQWVVDQFHTEAGSQRVTGEIFSSAVNAWTNKQISRLDGAVKQFEGNDQALAQVAALVRNPQGIKPGTRLHDAAKEIRTILDDALKYMRAAGVNVGEVRGGYYPREFDMRAVMRDSKGFIDAVAQAYRENGMAAKDAAESAKQLHDGIVFGESGSVFRTDRGSPQAPFLKGRVFGKSVDSEKHPLYKYLMHDPSTAIPIYLERAAKRAEIARRFGDNFEKWGELEKKIVAEGGGAALEKLRDYVTLAARLKAPGVSDFSLRAASVARTWGSLMFLEKAMLSSLTEFITPAIRSGNALDVARSLKSTLADLFTKTEDAAERRAFAEDLGIIASKLSDQVSAARFSGGEPVSMLESKILAKYFRRTGLTQWTDATFVAAADLGRVFLRRLSKDMEGGGGKLTKRYLAELGVPEAQAAEFAKYALSKNDGMPGAGDLSGPMGDLYRTAVRRFTQQSIMRPDATLRPGWMAHPIGSIVGQLQSFNYAFFENVLKRNARLAKGALTEADYTMLERARMLTPTLMLPMLVAAAYGIGELRDAAFGDPERRKEETGTQKVLKAASRGVPIAPLDPILNYATAARYQRGSADVFAGPVLGTAGRGLDAARNVALNNSPKTNTAERQAAKAVYDIFVEPTVNLMLTASPVTLAAAAATQAAGSGRTREKFVSAIAGEQKKRNQPAQ